MDIPIVFLTTYSDEDTITRTKKATPFGDIIKPVENRDLQIMIEMAFYKFRVEKELKEKQQSPSEVFFCQLLIPPDGATNAIESLNNVVRTVLLGNRRAIGRCFRMTNQRWKLFTWRCGRTQRNG